SQQEASSSKGSLEGKNIMLDAGHGGKDPGTIALNDEKEKTLSLKYTKSLKEQLENQGATVILTRENDRYLSLNERVAASESDLTQQEASSSKGSLEGKNIMLDAGHGGKDPGTIALNDEKEKTLSLKYTKSLKEQLENQGATVILTRENDRYLSLNERVAASESYNTDAFVSIHFNAFTSEENHGASTHFFDEGDDQELAQSIQSDL